MTNRNLKYISFFRWIFFSYIVVFHIQFFISGSYILYFTQIRFDHVHLITDCFFVISGFLLSKYFNQPKSKSKSKSILSYHISDFLIFVCLALSVVFGRVIFFITNNIKRQALKIPNCFKRIY